MPLCSAVLMSRLSGQDDVVIGTPVANRQRREIESLLGFFVNTLALRVRLHDAPSVAELLARVRDDSLRALEHQDLPFEDLVNQLGVARDPSRSPLFQATFAMQNFERRTHAAELGHLLVALDILAAGATSGAVPIPDRPLTSSLVAEACQLLERDVTHQWTLAELSARLYVGPFHLARQFVRSVGMPPMRYLARWRAQRAAGLLVSTDQPVAAIGAAVGWPDPSQFSRRFRAEFGVSPRAYRRHVAVLTGIASTEDEVAVRVS